MRGVWLAVNKGFDRSLGPTFLAVDSDKLNYLLTVFRWAGFGREV